MNLKPAQKTTLKTHFAANTNQVTPTAGPAAGVAATIASLMTGVNKRDPDVQNAVAGWYNGNALAGDAQPFSNLFVWNDNVTELVLSTAIDWTTQPPHGLGGSPTVDQQQLAIGNKWWLWDQIVGRKGYIDFTDSQARNGVLQVWGNVAAPSTAASIGSESSLCAKLNGRRVELALAGNAVGLKTAWNAACVVPTGFQGSRLLQSPLSQPDIDDIVQNG